MDASRPRRWLWAAILAGIVYFVVGIAFASLANTSASDQMRSAWRVAAFLTSAVAFAVHIVYEHFRLNNSPLPTALHTSAGAALGGFALAVAANVKAQLAAPSHQLSRALALVVWPLLAAAIAFVVALAAAAILARVRRLGRGMDEDTRRQ